MVDLEQDVRWEYSEGPSIGSYVQVSSGRSNRAPRNTRTRRHLDDALGRSLLDDTPETPDIDLYRLQPPGANPTSLKGRACWHVTRWLGTIGKAVGEDWLLLLLLGASTALIGGTPELSARVLVRAHIHIRTHNIAAQIYAINLTFSQVSFWIFASGNCKVIVSSLLHTAKSPLACSFGWRIRVRLPHLR
eukprot:m.10989 g.10989  ORF g.10989 m.10989 type:complete len:190 (+) comp4381_c0_seq2:71-640(+)